MIKPVLITLIAITSQPVPAEPKASPARWVRASDLPRIDFVTRPMTFDLSIDPKGMPTYCEIVFSSGSDELDASICKAVLKRARFDPALSEAGDPVFFVSRNRLSLIRPRNHKGRNRAKASADVIATSPRVSYNFDELVSVVTTLDGSGYVESCEVLESSGENGLDELACEVARDVEFRSPPLTNGGDPIPGLRLVTVAFENGPKVDVRFR